MRPSTKTASTSLSLAQGQSVASTRFAILPGSIVPSRSSTPKIFAAPEVSAANASSLDSPASTAVRIFSKIAEVDDNVSE